MAIQHNDLREAPSIVFKAIKKALRASFIRWVATQAYASFTPFRFASPLAMTGRATDNGPIQPTWRRTKKHEQFYTLSFGEKLNLYGSSGPIFRENQTNWNPGTISTTVA